MFKMPLEILIVAVISTQSTAFAGQWYKGDLHSHSVHSDGDSSVTDVIASVEAKGLDFFVLTDHDNDMDGNPIHWSDPGYVSDTTVLLYGVEWSNSDGHANVWSAWPFDYTALWSANRNDDPVTAVEAAHHAGALFSINHPVHHAWKFPVVEGTDCVEIWNGPMVINNNFKATHEFWDNILMERRRVTGVGGSDTHYLNGILTHFTGHGNPTTWVYAGNKDAESILQGIANGNVSISYTVDAPRLEFMADKDGDKQFETVMGDVIVSDGSSIDFKISLVGGETGSGDRYAIPSSIIARINEERLNFWDMVWFSVVLGQMDGGNIQLVSVIKDAQVHGAWLISGGTDSVEFTDVVSSGSPAYYRVEVYGAPDVEGLSQLIYGMRMAVSNPIYIGY
jgi:predicted metal-dependent phosphoesterase TrpH